MREDNKQRQGAPNVARTLAGLGLTCVALLCSIPYLVPFHTPPIPSFHAEWTAAVLGLASVAALAGTRGIDPPGAAWLTLSIAAIAVIQTVSGHAPVSELSTLFALCLVWAGLLACIGRRLAQAFGQAYVSACLAAAILIGSVLAALLGFGQAWLALSGWPGYSLAAGGPLGQANHLNVYLWLGQASALYLRVAGKIPTAGFWAASSLLMLAAVSTGQRSSFLYVAALLAAAFWRQLNEDRARMRDGRRLALGIGLLFVLMQPVPSWLPISNGDVRPPPALRTVQQLEGPSVRLQLLRLGLSGIVDSPLIGNGIGSYPGLAYAKADAIAPEDNPGPAEHAHNLLVDVAAELGLPAALLVAVAAFLWFRRLPGRTPNAEAGWAAAIVGMLGLHSMIEYPLWHTYFLGPLAFIAGAFGGGRRFGSRISAAVLTAALVIHGAWTLHDLRRDYARLELALGSGDKAALLGIPQVSLLTPWVQTTACVSLDPERIPLADGRAVCEAAMKFAPTPEAGANLAAFLRREGKEDDADDLLRRIARASGVSSSR